MRLRKTAHGTNCMYDKWNHQNTAKDTYQEPVEQTEKHDPALSAAPGRVDNRLKKKST